MSESTVDDLLNLDFDPDILIDLLGKLSLDNMPLDVTETLLSLENKTEVTMQNGEGDKIQCKPYSSELCSSNHAATPSVSAQETKTDVRRTVDVEKERFLSSIGLVSGAHRAARNSEVKSGKDLEHGSVSNVETSNVQHEVSSYELNNGYAPVVDGVPCLQDDEFDRLVKGMFSNLCDKNKLDIGKMPFFSAGQSTETFTHPFHELFQHQGKVINIQLSDLDCSSKFDQTALFLSPDEDSTSSDTSFFPALHQTSKEVLCSENNHVSTEKFVSSPDSGYTSCSSAISPCSPPDLTESQSMYDIFEDTDDDLQSIVAAIVEAENSLKSEVNAPLNTCNIPTLGSSEDPEYYKEQILNFLKEPVPINQSPPKQPEIKDSSSSELQPKSTFLSECTHPVKKYPSKSKEWKLGFELKYASKSDLRHSTLLTKLKHPSERNKILKQIQEDERALKRIKVIQLLDKKLKRTAADDRENKRQKIQCKDSC